MPTILISLIAALADGSSIGTVLAGLTTVQWVTLAVGVAEELEPEAKALLASKHPSLSAMVEQLAEGVGTELAAKAAQDWFVANGEAAIARQPGIAGQ